MNSNNFAERAERCLAKFKCIEKGTRLPDGALVEPEQEDAQPAPGTRPQQA